MERKYLNHHKLLVFGLYLLNQSSISHEMIMKASTVLHEYVSQFQILYGKKNMTCNLHLLLHLPVIVQRFGQLFVTSCFPHEYLNGILKSLVHGTRYAELQICSSISLFFNYSLIKSKYISADSTITSLVNKLIS